MTCFPFLPLYSYRLLLRIESMGSSGNRFSLSVGEKPGACTADTNARETAAVQEGLSPMFGGKEGSWLSFRCFAVPPLACCVLRGSTRGDWIRTSGLLVPNQAL